MINYLELTHLFGFFLNKHKINKIVDFLIVVVFLGGQGEKCVNTRITYRNVQLYPAF